MNCIRRCRCLAGPSLSAATLRTSLLLLLPRTRQSCHIYTLSVSADTHTLRYLHGVISTDIYTLLYQRISRLCNIYGYLELDIPQ